MASSIIGPVIGGAMGTVGGIFGSIAGIKADKQLSKLVKDDPKYTSSPYAANKYGLAQNILNARSAGAANAGRNIQGAQADAAAGITRNATDSSQALALLAGGQGAADNSINNQQDKEEASYMSKLGNLNAANDTMTGEHDKLFDDSVRRWQDQVNTVLTQYKMRQAGAQSFTNMGQSAQSGMNGMGGGGGGGGMSDIRLKENYHVIGKSRSGINVYEFSYKGNPARYIGAMAHEVGEAAYMTESGFFAVDYSMIDVPFKQIS